MEKIKFYKLVSPYPEDETLNCNLSVTDLDDNFLAFKDNDIKNAQFDGENMIISIERNNGEKINIDVSEILDTVDEKIEEATSGLTPSPSIVADINLEGELTEDGTLILSWTTVSGEFSTEISGFLTEAQTEHDETMGGTGSNTNPFRIANNEKTAHYRSVLGVIDELPTPGEGENLIVGERWIIKHPISLFGRLYNKQGMEMVKSALKLEESVWRVPTKNDWDKLFEYAEACQCSFDDYDIETYYGDICGRVLKGVPYWNGDTNLDTFGFTACPSGYVTDGTLTGTDDEDRFWTNTEYLSTPGINFIKGFSASNNGAYQDKSKDGEFYSIRLVRDINKINVSDIASILGNTYHVINLPEINQAWIVESLSYNPGSEFSEQYDYSHEGLVTNKYVICHWNGSYWEKKELNPGDKVSVTNNNTSIEYTCVLDGVGNQELVKGLKYQVQNGERRLIIDAGWY